MCQRTHSVQEVEVHILQGSLPWISSQHQVRALRAEVRVHLLQLPQAKALHTAFYCQSNHHRWVEIEVVLDREVVTNDMGCRRSPTEALYCGQESGGGT